MLPTTAGWDAFIQAHPHSHILQTSAWGRLKSEFGWRAEFVPAGQAGALGAFPRVRGPTLGRMKQKTRYNIGLAGKKGVSAQPALGAADLERFTQLMATTGARDGFGVHHPDYYRRALALFQPAGQCVLVLAAYQGEALAGVMAFIQGDAAWY